jgi:hypothetical protein
MPQIRENGNDADVSPDLYAPIVMPSRCLMAPQSRRTISSISCAGRRGKPFSPVTALTSRLNLPDLAARALALSWSTALVPPLCFSLSGSLWRQSGVLLFPLAIRLARALAQYEFRGNVARSPCGVASLVLRHSHRILSPGAFGAGGLGLPHRLKPSQSGAAAFSFSGVVHRVCALMLGRWPMAAAHVLLAVRCGKSA